MNQTQILKLELTRTYNDRGWYSEPAEPKFVIAISKALDKEENWERPYSWVRGWKKAGTRAERLLWLQYVTGHHVTSSKNLTNGEAYRICNWLDGLHPYTAEFDSLLPVQFIKALRGIEIRQWMRNNLPTISQMAEAFLLEKSG